MNRICKTVVLVANLALLSAGSAFTQTSQDSAETTSPATVAFVYIQTSTGVYAFDSEATGTLTPIKGSPFQTVGEMEDSNGKYLISVGTNYLFAYAIEPDGAVGNLASKIDTQDFSGAECGNTSVAGRANGSVLDRTGQYLYVLLYGATVGEYTNCAAWQSYGLSANGEFSFLGSMHDYNTAGNGDAAYPSTVPVFSGNNKFGYGVFGGEYGLNFFSTFARGSNGLLNVGTFSGNLPTPQPDYSYWPVIMNSAADSSNHLALAMFEEYEAPIGEPETPQLASYTINPATGAFTTTNTWADMPSSQFGYPNSMAISPSGNLLAVAGVASGPEDSLIGGAQIFHFNGAAPITNDSPLSLPNAVDYNLAWDNNNHLYALSYAAEKLHVFTVSPTSITEVPGSPYRVENGYGINGLIVVPKL